MTTRPFVPDPLLCLRCRNWGHPGANCRRPPRCYHCGRIGPHSAPLGFACCPPPSIKKCINCEGEHFPAYKGCPARIQAVHKNFADRGLQPRAPQSPRTFTPVRAPWSRTPETISPLQDFPSLPTQNSNTPVPMRPSIPPENITPEVVGHFKHLLDKLDIALKTINTLYNQLPPALLKAADRVCHTLAEGIKVSIPILNLDQETNPDHPPGPPVTTDQHPQHEITRTKLTRKTDEPAITAMISPASTPPRSECDMNTDHPRQEGTPEDPYQIPRRPPDQTIASNQNSI